MIELLLKTSFAIGIALLFYKLLLQKESFFAANRFYLLGCLALAFVLPFVTLPKLVSHQGYLATLFEQRAEPEQSIPMTRTESSITEGSIAQQEETLHVPVPQQSIEPAGAFTPSEPPLQVQPAEQAAAKADISWGYWLTMLYLFGVTIFTISLLFQLGTICYIILTATDKIKDGDYVIVNTAGRQAPCSFFKYIFIYPDDYDFVTYEHIITHEKIHARLGHSFDLLLTEIAVIVLWFNPLIWIFRKEIEKNIEYQTDAELLEKEQVNKKQYQLNLLQIAVPNKALSITTNYNQSLLKQRIMMMNAKKSLPHAYWKYAFLAPLFFGMLLLLNEPAVSQSNFLISSTIESPFSTSADSGARATTKETIEKNKVVSSEKTVEKAVQKPKANAGEDQIRPIEPVREVIGALREPVGTARGTVGEQRRPFNINITRNADMTEGYWYAHKEGNEYCIQFKGDQGSSNWNMSSCFPVSSFQKKGEDLFVMTREAGTLELTGNLDAEVSQGKYKFVEDASFKNYLAANNITSKNQNMMLHLFFGGVGKNYVDFLKKNYTEVSGDRLLELAIHGVSLQSYQEYMALFQKHSNKKPAMQEVVEAKIHGIDQEYVQQLLAMGYTDLTLRKMMEAKIHGISAAYVEGLRKAGFNNLPIDKVIQAKIHGVNPEAVNEMQALGFGTLGLNKIIELKIHGINAAYIRDLRAAGFENLTVDQVISAKIHGLSASSIKEIKALGFKDLGFNDLMSAKIHGVSAAYVEDLTKAGFPNLSMNKVVEAKIHGINGNFIQKARQEGYNLNSIDKYISLKIHGMALESLKEGNKKQ